MDKTSWHLKANTQLRRLLAEARKHGFDAEVTILKNASLELDAEFEKNLPTLVHLPTPTFEHKKQQPKPPKPKLPYTGIRADDLPAELTEEEFQAYLSIKREEKPNNQFFADEDGIRIWLQNKGKVIKK